MVLLTIRSQIIFIMRSAISHCYDMMRLGGGKGASWINTSRVSGEVGGSYLLPLGIIATLG
jgi:hypothetical protein